MILNYFKILFLSFIFAGAVQAQPNSAPAFRLSLTEVPKNFDPHKQRSSSGAWLLQQLYRNFYVYDDKRGLVGDLGETCEKRIRRWTCKIKKDLKWSNGSLISAEDFVLSIRRVLTLPHPRADLLFNIENAKEVFEQKKPANQLGVRVVDPYTFEIRWLSDTLDNDVVLSSPLFPPLPIGTFKKDVFSGPYSLADQNNQRVILIPNRLYWKKNDRPRVEFQIFEENLAVKAFEKKQLDFLRRVPTAQIPEAKKSAEFHWQPVLRLDAIVFGPELKDKLELRKRLAESLDYEQWRKLFDSPERIGCPGLSAKLYGDGKKELCYSQKKNVKPEEKEIKLTYAYSTMGGDDFRRQAEWLQSEWKTKLKIDLNLQGLENKIFQDMIEKNPPALFRKGLNLEYPSCSMALKMLTSDNPDSYIQMKNPQFDSLVREISTAPTAAATKRLCTQALQLLVDNYVMIPTGRINFAVMASRAFTGWRLNELFHLDLSELRPVSNL